MQTSALLIGCGYLGERVALAWQAEGMTVHALTRSRSETFRARGWQPIIGDVTDPASLVHLPQVDRVLYAVGMDRSSGRSMHEVYVNGLANVLHALPQPQRLIYISSTSVYGFTQGEEVDESAPCEPIDESGKIVKTAERTVHQFLPESVILRFAGIYGPRRLLREKAIRAGEPLIGDAEKWLNLIHVDDGVQAVNRAMLAGRAGGIYNISDGAPVRRRAFYTKLAELLGAPTARFEPYPAGQEAPIHDRANRRILNQRAREELGFAPIYPSFEAGLAAAISAS